MVSQSFRDRADSACFWEAWVASVLARAGLYTSHYPFEISDDKDLSEPDLVVSDNGTGALFEVEVKSLNLDFNNARSYPYEEVLVCSQNSFLRRWPDRDHTCRDFLLVSKKTGSIVWIPAMTQVQFGREVLDRSRNELYKAVTVPKSVLRPLADFVDVVKGEF